MKKLIYSAVTLSMAFFAASCQQEMSEPVAQESAVTFSVELPGVQTKAIGDGFNVDQLVYEVWKTEEPNERDLTGTDVNGNPKATRLYQDKAVMATKDGEQKTVISLNLVHDQNYTVLFWAQKEGTEVYNTEQLTNVHYAKGLNGGENGYFSNQENYAAFYQTEFLTAEEIEKPGMRRTELVRPFAQLNIGTKNTSEDYDVEVLSSKVIVSNVGTCFNVAQNYVADPEKGRNQPQIAVGEPATVTFDTATDPSDEDEYIIVNNQKYEYVAMNYLFATGNNVTVSYEINTKLTATNSSTTDAKVSNTVINVPLQENYRTNIIGNLLTSSTEYEVVIDATWDDVNDPELNGDGYVVEVWDGKYAQEPPMVDRVYQISLASELAWLSAAVNGTLIETKSTVGYKDAQNFEGVTFKLMEDIDLLGDKGARWIPIGAAGKPFKGTFDGNGKTISNLTVATEGKASAGLFGATTSATINNVTVVNANITGHYKTGVIVGDGLCAKIENCHVEGATVISTPWKNEKGEWDDANNVGGIVGYLSAEPTAYVKNCSVKDATITAYRKVGGIVGAANGPAEVTGNTVENVTVTADQTDEYKEVKAAEAGQVVGFKHADANVAEGQEGEDVVVIRKVDSTEEMAYAVAEAKTGETIYVGNGEVALPDFENKALHFVGIHADAAILEPVSSHVDAFWQGAELNFTGLKIKGTSYTGNANGYVKSAKETYTNCAFVDGYYMFAGDETIVDKCVFTGKYNSYFWTGSADDITFNECKFNGVERIVKVCTVGHTGVERDVTFNSCQFTATEQKKAAIEIDGTQGSSYTVNINDCTQTGFAAGEFTGEPMFNIEGMDKVMVYVDGVLFVSDYVVKGNTYEVYSAAGLAKWAYMVNNVDNTLNLKLMEDIELPAFEIAEDAAKKTYIFTETPITVTDGVPSGSNWVPAGNYGDSEKEYKGAIDGNDHSVSGMCINSSTGFNGFVGLADGGNTMESAVDYDKIYIENLTIKNASIYSTSSYTAAIAGYIRNIRGIRNCHIINSTVSGANHTAGIAGYNYTRKSDNKVVIADCSVDDNTVVNGAAYVGGIVAYNYGSIIIHCSNAADITGSGSYVGGIVGYTRDYQNYRSAYIIACMNSGDVIGGDSYVGGITGYNLYDAPSHTPSESCIVACSSTASNVVAPKKTVAILVGDAYANSGTIINGHHYGSWGLKIDSVTNIVNGGEMNACYAFGSAADITQTEIDAMNAAIDTYNTGRTVTDPTFCPYKWTWSEGNLPVLQ